MPSILLIGPGATGVIVDRGRRHGIPTPCNEMAVALLKVTRTRQEGECHR